MWLVSSLRDSGVAQWQSKRLLTARLRVRVSPPELPSREHWSTGRPWWRGGVAPQGGCDGSCQHGRQCASGPQFVASSILPAIGCSASGSPLVTWVRRSRHAPSMLARSPGRQVHVAVRSTLQRRRAAWNPMEPWAGLPTRGGPPSEHQQVILRSDDGPQAGGMLGCNQQPREGPTSGPTQSPPGYTEI